MKIRLLKNVEQGGQLKTTIRKKTQTVIGWFKGVEMEVSDATGRKLIEAGDAEEVAAAETTSEDGE